MLPWSAGIGWGRCFLPGMPPRPGPVSTHVRTFPYQFLDWFFTKSPVDLSLAAFFLPREGRAKLRIS